MLGGGGVRPDELPPSRGWPCLVESIIVFLKPSEAQTNIKWTLCKCDMGFMCGYLQCFIFDHFFPFIYLPLFFLPSAIVVNNNILNYALGDLNDHYG